MRRNHGSTPVCMIYGIHLVEWKRIVMIFAIVIVVVFAEIHFWTNTRTLIFQIRFRRARSVRSLPTLSSLLLDRKREREWHDKQFGVVHTMEKIIAHLQNVCRKFGVLASYGIPGNLSTVFIIAAWYFCKRVHLTQSHSYTHAPIEWNTGRMEQ